MAIQHVKQGLRQMQQMIGVHPRSLVAEFVRGYVDEAEADDCAPDKLSGYVEASMDAFIAAAQEIKRLLKLEG